ncbi:dithiobiotin synthetase [compost metagenome]
MALVARDYLGCINHTLLSIDTLKQRNIPLDYMIFNGNFDPDTFRVLYKHLPRSTHAIRIPELEEISPKTIAAAAQQIKFF